MGKALTTAKTPGKKNITGGATDNEIINQNKELKELLFEMKEKSAKMLNPETIPTREPFVNLFPIKDETLEDIMANMKKIGFDVTQPLLVGIFPLGKALIDGHTRREASINLEMETVPVLEIEFKDDQEALDYAIHLQKDRRNITDAELFSYIKAFDKVETRGRKMGSSEPISSSGRSAHRTADLTGTSATKVKKARAIEKEGSEEIKEAVRTGGKTINGAYNEVKGKNSPQNKKTPEIKIPLSWLVERMEEEKSFIEKNHNVDFCYGKFITYYNLLMSVSTMDDLVGGKFGEIGPVILKLYSEVDDMMNAKYKKETECATSTD